MEGEFSQSEPQKVSVWLLLNAASDISDPNRPAFVGERLKNFSLKREISDKIPTLWPLIATTPPPKKIKTEKVFGMPPKLRLELHILSLRTRMPSRMRRFFQEAAMLLAEAT